ncbi:MAG: phage protein [Chthonomonadales bacterium]|nr:phage protein [Chthonomonadales bacterium]
MTAESGKTRKREEAIAALLAHPTIAGAAKAAGISEPTLLRWLKEEEFNADYREARRQMVEVAIGLLQKASGAAVTTLVTIMQDGEKPGSVRVSAARSVLDMAFRGVELQDMEVRLTALESALAEQDGAA